MDAYGSKIVENIVQAISRDLFAYAMKNLQRKAICMHIHDEIVIEAPAEIFLKDITTAMETPPCWAQGLALDAEGSEPHFTKRINYGNFKVQQRRISRFNAIQGLTAEEYKKQYLALYNTG